MFSARNLFRTALLGSAIALCAFAAAAQAQPYQILHEFAGPPADGSYPYNNVSFGPDGTLYGTTNLGGANNAGTVFEITQDGTYTVLHSFDGAAGGSDPNAGVTLDPSNGDLYGTTTFAGSGGACRGGCGVFYRLSAGGKFKVLHDFTGDDGRYPAGQLVRDTLGDIYGIATSGGPGEGGAIFEYSATGTFSILHTFSGADGFEPQGSLLLDRAGNLYGATYAGGTDDYGTIFRLKSNGRLKTLYSFTGGNDGGNPTGGLDWGDRGTLYGATNLAGNGSTPNGTVFKLAPDGTLNTLYAFSGGNDGAYPAGNVLFMGGKAYGTTAGGGADEDGVVYAVDPANGNETVVHDFNDTDGAGPQAGLTKYRQHLYGTAASGGSAEFGLVYRVRKE
jgi:uncharacterized repeat protein (TIGR03803 family)